MFFEVSTIEPRAGIFNNITKTMIVKSNNPMNAAKKYRNYWCDSTCELSIIKFAKGRIELTNDGRAKRIFYRSGGKLRGSITHDYLK